MNEWNVPFSRELVSFAVWFSKAFFFFGGPTKSTKSSWNRSRWKPFLFRQINYRAAVKSSADDWIFRDWGPSPTPLGAEQIMKEEEEKKKHDRCLIKAFLGFCFPFHCWMNHIIIILYSAFLNDMTWLTVSSCSNSSDRITFSI